MKLNESVTTRYRRFALLAVTLLLPAISVCAEPSRAFLKCQRSLERSAAVHLERSNKARDKHERKLAQRALQSSGRATGSTINPEAIQDAIRRIRKWRAVEQARETYVENIIEQVLQLVGPDEPGFKCLDRGRMLKVYLGNQRAYEEVLEHVEKDLIQHIDLENLGADEGLVIISYNATQPTSYVRVNRRDALGGNLEFWPIRKGQYYRVTKAKAGAYIWELATRDLGSFRRDFRLSQLDLSFVVEPGKINYSGTFLLDIDPAGYFSASLNDRLVIALAMLEDRYPDLIGRYDIVNGLFPDDRFTEFYLREKEFFRKEAASENE